MPVIFIQVNMLAEIVFQLQAPVIEDAAVSREW